jgi:hypothetical protein
MAAVVIATARLELVLQTPDEVLAWVASMPAADRAEVSPEWMTSFGCWEATTRVASFRVNPKVRTSSRSAFSSSRISTTTRSLRRCRALKTASSAVGEGGRMLSQAQHEIAVANRVSWGPLPNLALPQTPHRRDGFC